MSNSLAPSLPSSLSAGQEASLGDDMEQLEREYLRELLMEQGVIGKSVGVKGMDSDNDSTLSGSAGAGHEGIAHKYDILHDLQKFEIKSQLKDDPLPATSEADEEENDERRKTPSETGRISRILPAAAIRKIIAKIPLNKNDNPRELNNGQVPDDEVLSEHSGSVGKMLSEVPRGKSDRDVGRRDIRAKAAALSISFSGKISGMMPSVLNNHFTPKVEETQKSAEKTDVEDKSSPRTPQRPKAYMRPAVKDTDDSSDDRATVPETPPGFRGFIEIPKKQHAESDPEEDANEPLASTKQKYKIAACLAVFLFVFLVVCGVLLTKIRKDSAAQTALSDGFDGFDWTFKPTVQPSAAPSVSSSPTQRPSTRPSNRPTLSPTVTPVPTQTPSTSPTFTKSGNFTDIMSRISPSTIDKILSRNTAHNRAYRWIIEDDLYYTYSEDRIIQRWVLALLSMTFSPAAGNNENIFASWMKYTNECTWAVSSKDRLAECDRNGVLRNLVFNNANLEGRFPTELYLLSSLRRLVISGNNMNGQLDGRIVSLQELEELTLNHNMLTGSIPSQLSKLRKIQSIALTANRLSGRIPRELGELGRLTSLDLRNNRLSGKVPQEIAFISALRKIELSENSLTGDVPTLVCSSLVIESFSADCYGEVQCSCCTSCESGVTTPPSIPPPTGEPSSTPTRNPTRRPTPRPTANPTPPPTPRPTANPTPPPTPVPTPRPTLTGPTLQPTLPRPTFRPTPRPTSAEPCNINQFLRARRTCYEVGQTIEIEFGNCDAKSDDFFGVYPATADPKSLDYPALWLWTCGDQTCRQLTPSGRVEFDSRSQGTATWPLREGAYKVFLIRNSNLGGRYQGFMETREIEISGFC